jgi:hypothetical protein
MRVMVLIKATRESEAGVLPDEKLLTEMGAYNEKLVKAGVMLVSSPASGCGRSRRWTRPSSG